MRYKSYCGIGLIVVSLSLVCGCSVSDGGERTMLSPPISQEEMKADQDWQALKSTYLTASRAEHDHRLEDWQTAASWNFDDGKMPDGFKVYDGQWEVRDGQLEAVSGKPDGNRTIRITNCQWPVFRITFDVSLNANDGQPSTRIGDVGIRFNADAKTGSFAKGYVVILAHYANQAAVIYRMNVPFARTEFAPIQPGKTHRVMVEIVKPHIRAWVDDKVVLEAWERTGTSSRDHSDFMEMDPNRDIVLHTYDSRMVIDNLEIQVPVKK